MLKDAKCNIPRFLQSTNSVEEIKEKIVLKENFKKTILVVEDEPMVLMAMKSMIKRLNCNVDTAENGEIAVAKVKDMNKYMETKYSLIFMDINMPIMNGYAATKIIKNLIESKELFDSPILCLSAQDTQLHKKICEECGFSEQSKILI